MPPHLLTDPTDALSSVPAAGSRRATPVVGHLRYQGRLYSIGIGRTHARTHVIVLVQDLQIRIVDAATGELLRELTLDPSKRYQGTGRPPGPAR